MRNASDDERVVHVIFTPGAERHIERLHDYIAERARGLHHAHRGVLFEPDDVCTAGKPARRFTAGQRTIGFERRVTIAFMVTDEAVLIEGIFYGGRDVEGAFDDKG
jgi:toxin ParE1/3/4